MDFLSWKWSERHSANPPRERQYSSSLSVSGNGEKCEQTVQSGRSCPRTKAASLGKKRKNNDKEQNTVTPVTVFIQRKITSFFFKLTQSFFCSIILPICWSDWPILFKTAKKISHSSCVILNGSQIVLEVLCWTYVEINTILNIWHRTEVSAMSMIFNLFSTIGHIRLCAKILIHVHTSC